MRTTIYAIVKINVETSKEWSQELSDEFSQGLDYDFGNTSNVHVQNTELMDITTQIPEGL